jgi:hypothetical protein
MAMSSGEAVFINGGVWVTDGSKSGTFELQLALDPGYDFVELLGSSGLYFHPYGSELLFFALEEGDGEDRVRAFTTDGSKAGTKGFTLPPSPSFDFSLYLEEGDFATFGKKMLILDSVTAIQGKPPEVEFLVTNLTGHGTQTFTIKGPPLPFDFAPNQFTGFGKLVLFSAVDYQGVNSLWVSNGTAAGTKPIVAKGASGDGLFAGDLTIFGKKVLFAGQDNADDSGLWITNGTSAGTKELLGTGSPFGFAESLSPQDITVAGRLAFFAATDGLWMTNGTSARTKEIVVAGGEDGGLEVDPSGIFAFGDEVLFLGNATNSFSRALFVSDGTAKGSFELSATAEIQQDLVVLGSNVLFEAEDAAHKFGLWMTNGTKGGTGEIRVHGAYFFGLFDETGFHGAAIGGSEAVFYGEDKLERFGLWVTNGSTAGTREVYSSLSVTDLTAVPSGKAAQLLADSGDILIAGHHSTLSGSKGADLFEFATPGSLLHPDGNMIFHFDAATDKIAFSDRGFHLGLANPGAATQTLPADFFTANATGSFTTAGERFAYASGTGALYYDAHGDKGSSSRELVATFTGRPHLTASDVFFVS